MFYIDCSYIIHIILFENHKFSVIDIDFMALPSSTGYLLALSPNDSPGLPRAASLIT